MKFPKSPEQEGHVLKSLVLVKNLPHLLGGWANVLNNLMKVEIFPEALGQMAKVLLLPWAAWEQYRSPGADGEFSRNPWQDDEVPRYHCLDVDGIGDPGGDGKCSAARRQEEAKGYLDGLEDIGDVRSSCANGKGSR